MAPTNTTEKPNTGVQWSVVGDQLSNPEAPTAALNTVAVTESAAAKGLELLQKEGKENQGLRIKVVPGGCSGFAYQFIFDKEVDGDLVVEKEGLKVFVDQASLELIKGSSLDYSESLTDSGFKVNNPNAKSGCGCGESFTV